MTYDQMTAQMAGNAGFVAALDQSGGSTPEALRSYGIPDTAYSSATEMFKLIHEMRLRIVTAPAFSRERVIAAILFEQTLDSDVKGKPMARYLWEDRGVVPFVKVDSGRENEHDGVELMKPMPKLDLLLTQAVDQGVYGTKMRSVIKQASSSGIAALVSQQFEVAQRILARGLVPIIEPEVLIGTPDKIGAEILLRDEIHQKLEAVPTGAKVILKLTIPDVSDLYRPLTEHPKVQRVLALSGGYIRRHACEKLRLNHGMIASFSRALVEDLRYQMTDAEIGAALSRSADEIYEASTSKYET